MVRYIGYLYLATASSAYSTPFSFAPMTNSPYESSYKAVHMFLIFSLSATPFFLHILHTFSPSFLHHIFTFFFMYFFPTFSSASSRPSLTFSCTYRIEY